MSGDATTQSPLWGTFGDEGGTPEEVAADGAKGRKVIERGGDYSKGKQQDYGSSVIDGDYGGGQLDNGCRPSPVGVLGREAGEGVHVAGGGHD